MKEETIYVADSLGVFHPETIERQTFSLFDAFLSGGVGWMVIISLFLIAVFIAAWKAPRWVKEIGLGALTFSLFGTLVGFHQMCDAIQIAGDVAPGVICGGFKCVVTTFCYGLIVYFISLVIRVIQKPRI